MKYIKVGLVIGYVLVCASWTNGQVSKAEKHLVKYIDQHNNQALQLLEEIININSGTMNFNGVKAVADVLMPRFKALGMEVEWKEGSAWNRAGHLVAKTKGGKGRKILLIGHLDTVFELESPFQKYNVLNDSTASGPGIADMKGGAVIILQALSALHDAGLLKDMSITVVMTGDEELSGDPLSLSKQELVEAAKWADIALGFENGDGNPGTANVARRSSSGWTLKVTGNAAHSSQVFKPEVGAGAIYEAARILTEFYEALSTEEYLTFNPGMILGGTNVSYDESIDGGRATGKSNVVAKDAIVTGDIRTISPEQLQRTQKTMTEIATKHLPRTNATITFDEGYPPFAPTDGNYALLKQLSKVSTDLGFMPVEPVNPSNAGAADISFTSPYIEMGLDGLGMGGKNDHTVNEIGDLKVLPMQSKRAAVLLYRLTR
ncbi:M20/M25/M40 family metallo-hydrolase [Imperialibacter roseus]|uniref:M20/M25/M40 family metallo-hydrolase n=1 Tax=Imperialibacter roseus TaxID=1324217 RepID=A0ABZ0IWG6_9BACT|nr:M20/M25/M40 family metallo-hydrolase [Imperialibacter roseus]WOK08459.1 M20/M25/M40 family metallo-hydrolase [Imperialibacter roseus]